MGNPDNTTLKTHKKKALLDVIYLAACAVNSVTPEKSKVDDMDLKALFEAADAHMLTAVTAYALEKAGVRDNDFTVALAKAMRKTALFDAERGSLLKRLEDEKIWYLPLKGVITKELYPAFGLRQFSDNDILFDETRASDVRKIMEDTGFTCEEFGRSHDDTYKKPPVFNFEMHRRLFGPEHTKELNEYFRDVETRRVKDAENGYGYHFSDEDFYIYVIAHEYEHYSGRGTGLRSLLDAYVINDKLSFDRDYVDGELKKLGIADFEKMNGILAGKLFGKSVALGETMPAADLDTKEAEMLEKVFSSGTYGLFNTWVEQQVRKVSGAEGKLTGRKRLKYYISRAFPDQEFMIGYTKLARFKILMPLAWALRLVRTFKLRGKKVIDEVKFVEGLK